MSETTLKPYDVKLRIVGVTPLQQSREYTSTEPKSERETNDNYEKRTWFLRAHIDEHGRVFHPAGAFKQALVSAAQYNSEKIKGEGQKTYTQKVRSGVCILTDLVTDRKKDDLKRRDVYARAQGGKSKNEGRVWKYFPTLEQWHAETVIRVYDPIITEDVLRRIITTAGQFIGIGTWRPENGGEYGRFYIDRFDVTEITG